MESPDSLLLEDFGQKVDLTRRIREVLINYPEGTTVLKELIQNADDAGATAVRLCLDRRRHGTESLLSPTLAQWQGPALLVYNNAEFTEEDFVSISRIGGSSKHGQSSKTGRFGVGFNSVYHLTDLPSFVSGKFVVVFDPQSVYLPNISSANPGKRIEYVCSSAISLYKDQFFPYCAFGCDMKSTFSGTLFRFPLRNADQAAHSKLSRQAYSENDISSMFSELYEEGVFTLLFLKSVLSIEMYLWDDSEPEPRKLYSCSINSENEKTIWHRQALLRSSELYDSPNKDPCSFLLDFMCESWVGDHYVKRADTFYIVQAMASSSSRIGSFAAMASKEYDIHLLPWASVAACISDDLSDDDPLKIGRAFCFLPLPVRTGISVQINAYFEVSSNRRGIWYGADMDRSGKIRSVWNRLLLEDVVAPCFVRLLCGVQGFLGPTKQYYSLWPTGSFEEPWDSLVEHIYRNIFKSPVLHTDVTGGKWVSPPDAFLHDEEFIRSTELGEALLQIGMPVVHLPKCLFNMLLSYTSKFQLKVVTPDTVRQFLRSYGLLVTLSKFYKIILLEYCLEDIIDSDIGSYLNNLPLLPLANGDFGSFSVASEGVTFFICDDLEYTLLEEISDRLVDRSMPVNIFSRLSIIAECSKTNLVIFDSHKFVQLFHKFVPSDWKYRSKVFWDLESCCGHPTESWFRIFWQYLRARCKNLSIFTDWPILPSTSGHLHRASRQSKFINAEVLSDQMQALLSKIGCKILHSDYGVDHQDLCNYVCEADGAGVVESIFDVFSTDPNAQTYFQKFLAEEKDELRKFILDPKWYLSDCMHESIILKCKLLPIYRVFDPKSAKNIQFSALDNPPKCLPPLDVPRCLLGEDFICSSSDIEDEILLRYYEVVRMRKAFFYRQHVLSRVREMQPEVRDDTMLSILHDLPHLSLEDTSFREVLRDLEFVPTLGGSLRCPPVLYDPRNEELYALLDDSDSFPCGNFQESNILDMLQGLGLRTSVSPETIIKSAHGVERIKNDDPQKAYLRGKVLLSYLEVNAMRWLPSPSTYDQGAINNRFLSRATTASRNRAVKSDLEKFWSDLQMICWCPVLVSSPFQTLPWPTVSSMVAPPKVVRLKTDLWLVSASMRIFDGECSSTAMSHHLGWSSPPGGSVIAAQLLELGKNNEIVNDQVLRQELALAMPRIYSILMGMLGSDEIDIVKAVLEGSRWIWVGDGFATSDEVVLEGPLHLAPYVRVIPVDLAVFKDLFLELGIRECLKAVDYASILCRIAKMKGSLALDAQEIRAVIIIVQHLAEVQFHEQQMKIYYLPDVSGRLFAASDLVYNDAPWLLGCEDFSSSFSDPSSVVLNVKTTVRKFVHGNISNDVAEKLGVCSLRRVLLAESADSMNIGLSGAAEAFGQHEALTTRLKHILEMYADGPGVLFELVQNAEDAGASEVIFLLDKTQYGTSSVLSPEMADWQGPALYCFNDSIFSSQDLYAISRIGQESKLDQPFAIGRFGLGFNSVYHFTDIPMFVSGENLVMFDPHACNLPGVSPSHPGLRIRYAGKKLLEQFPDQFSPFLHFGCDMQQSFPGTLFRFSLRSINVADRSQIKKEVYDPGDVISLFTSFSEVVSEALIFLRNVKSISLFIKEGASYDMQLLHRVNKGRSSEEVNPSAVQNLSRFIHGNQQGGGDKDQLQKLSRSVDNLQFKYEKLVVMEKSTTTEVSHIWMTCECFGAAQVKSSHKLSKKSCNFIPSGCVAACLGFVNPETKSWGANEFAGVTPDLLNNQLASTQGRKDFEGRAFCFLPLPISTGLPAHVNAYFELSSNRRDIWFGSDMAGGGKKRSDWNLYLLQNVVAPAYGHLLERLALEVGPHDFFSFWPTTIGSEPWASMVRKLYIYIADSGLRILYTNTRGGQWVSSKQAIFPDFTFHRVHELVECLSDSGLPVVTVPQPILDRFIEVSPSLHFLTPQLLRSLLIRRKRGIKESSGVILTLEYCLVGLEIPFQCASLYGLPLIPLANGCSTTFDKKGVGERVYIARGEEYGLLKDSVPHQLVDCAIPEVVHEVLCGIARAEVSNISFLSCDLLEKLFLKLLPAEWQHAKQVGWRPGNDGQPSLLWMRLLWDYLKSSCEDLAMHLNWPILPVENSKLLQLARNSNVIQGRGLSENLSSLLLKVGCVFLSRDIPVEHPQLKDYVHSPTALGILDALLAVSGEPEKFEEMFVNATEGELHELRSFVLQSKWFVENPMDETHVSLIKHLPIFESFRSRNLMSLIGPSIWLKPNGVYEDLLDDSFVRTESEKERNILLNFLGIRVPSQAEFFKDYVLGHISFFISNKEALSTIFHDLKLLAEEDQAAKIAISLTPFVLASNGSWQQPSRLYDPRISTLQKVLHKEVFFPSDEFCDPVILESLLSVGLKQSLGFTGFLDCAQSVSLLHDKSDPEAFVYGKRLFVCLDILAQMLSAKGGEIGRHSVLCENSVGVSAVVESSDLQTSYQYNGDDVDIQFFVKNMIHDKPEEEFWSEMKNIAWCPVCTDTPFKGLPWLSSSIQVAPPSSVRPMTQILTVSSSRHILDGQCCSEYLQNKLGWMDCPSIDVLATQAVGLSKSYINLKLCCEIEPEFVAALQTGIPLLYSKMQEYVGTDEIMKLKSALDGVPWVWIGDDFVFPYALAFDSPVKFSPYLYVVPSELSEFRELLLALGVRLNFDLLDYLNVISRLHANVKEVPLSAEQLSFFHRVIEAVAELNQDGNFQTSLFIPDNSGILRPARDLVYNDAPWIESSAFAGKYILHPSISSDLANKLGIQSLRCISLVDEEMTKDLPCMDYAKICELIALHEGNDFLLFDLLELADSCSSNKVNIFFDKREHPRQSLLQHNLGEFQGPALVVVLEGTSLSRDEVCSLQLLPPWRLRGDTLNYGLGLLSCYSICDVLTVMSSDCYYIFDPRGLALSVSSTHAPAAKMFSLLGTGLTERFHDQFNPMLINQKMPWSSSDFVVIRMPLSSRFMEDGPECGSERLEQIFDNFMEHSSRTLLFLKSIMKVTLSTWEEGKLHPSEEFAVSVDSSSSILRNPFPEKKWRKFQLSRLFGNSNAAIKSNIIDVNLYQRGVRIVDQWLVVVSLGSGQTRNMALDRRYLAYNLIPVAGIAAHISRNGHPTDAHLSGSILSPLPLSTNVNIPVVILGYFRVRHNSGRYLLKYQDKEESVGVVSDSVNQLMEAWNRELMSCVCDSYIEMVLEIQKAKREKLRSGIEPVADRAVKLAMKAYRDQFYTFWPRSNSHGVSNEPEVVGRDRECIIEQIIRPFYARLVNLPVWQLHSGKLVKAEEGMFLSQPANGVGGNLLPATVCDFVKEHYPVFSVPWEMVTEIQALGITVREIKPKMVRDLLRVSPASIVLRSVDTYVDVLEYCLGDINLSLDTASMEFGSTSASVSNLNVQGFHGMPTSNAASSGGDALEMMTSLGKALFDFGRGVVEDIGRAGEPIAHRRNSIASSDNTIQGSQEQRLLAVVAELKGLPFPTAAKHLRRLGVNELWIGKKDLQELMIPLEENFIHLKCLERPILTEILSNCALQPFLNLKMFSFHLLAAHMNLIFHKNWINHVMATKLAPWFSWDNTTVSRGEGGPSPEWIRLFWKSFSGSPEELALFSDWPLIPAFLGRPILCRVKERHMVFIPPADLRLSENRVLEDSSSESESVHDYILAFKEVQEKYPWLLSLLNQCNIPICDIAFLDYALPCNCFPASTESIGHVISLKLVAAKQAGYFPELGSLLSSDSDELFALFASDYVSDGSKYRREDLEVLCSLPIYRTVVGTYKKLQNQDLCIISSNSFFKPNDEHCFCYSYDSNESSLLRALGVSEIQDTQILVRFGLPGFESKPESEREDILIYLYVNWEDLQADSNIIEALKETRFVRTADEYSTDLFKPKDMFDPADVLLTSVFSGERNRFPGERFGTDGWLRILRKAGLRTASEADVALECARRVEILGNECMKPSGYPDVFESELPQSEVSVEIWSLAGSVVECIFSNFANFYGNNFCNLLGKIAFVPAEKGFPGVGGRRGVKKVLSSYNDAVLLKDWPLAWSCAPILSKQNFVPPDYSWGPIHLRSPPAFSIVLKHLQVIGKNRGEDTLAQWPNSSGIVSIDEASCEVLKYLDKAWNSLSSSERAELHRVAFIPVANGTRLVTVNSLFIRLAINLSPFAFELPSLYLPFIKTLKDLGLQDTLSVASAKDLLFFLQKSCGYHRLNPNELRAVMELLYFVCNETAKANISEDSDWVSEAIVPDNGCRLVHAKLCVYIDSYGSRFIKLIDTSRLRFVHPDLPERMCAALRVRKLSDVVIEELENEDQLQIVEDIRSVTLASIRQKLMSRSFQSAVWTVINRIASYVEAFEKLAFENVKCSLESVAEKLQFVQFIYSRFILRPKSLDITDVTGDFGIPGWADKKQNRSLYFINQSKSCILIAEPPPYLSVFDVIAVVVSQILGSPFSLPIGPLFSCLKDSEAVIAVILKLCMTKGKTEPSHGYSTLIGKDILPQDALQVQYHPLRPFYTGEVVAWRSQNGDKLKYGRVPEDVRPSAGQALYRFQVEVAPGLMRPVLSSHIFSFKSVAKDDKASSSAMVEQPLAIAENEVQIKVPESSGKDDAKLLQLQQGKELQYGQVSAEELVQAVHEMLAAAGINLDVEQKSLLQTTLTLQEQLKESQTALLLEQEKADLATKEADTAKAAWVCRVCLSAEVDISIVPCGHVLCRRCSSAVSRCPFCRLQVSRTMKIYRP